MPHKPVLTALKETFRDPVAIFALAAMTFMAAQDMLDPIRSLPAEHNHAELAPYARFVSYLEQGSVANPAASAQPVLKR